ncbi:MAG: AraC family transcriptional regulator ligand-binding domain-containing protein [Oleispira sp.]|nr:AraC family transcriptional regulator ligand-binding domain-containing protein [Oleispira sp.]MBL4879936.1 AraC family transcriptional regulator ligand-binding domain-containing protein [Oleispira sp.]
MSTPYINSSFLNGFSQLVILKGGNPAALYELAGLDKEVFIEENLLSREIKNLLIPFDKFVDLLEITSQQLNYPDVAMELARQQSMMILAPLRSQLNQCENVLQAVQVIVKYLKILVSGYQVEIKIDPQLSRISFTVESEKVKNLVQYQDYALASAVSILHGMLGKSYPLRSCYFLRDEKDAERIAEYTRYFGCPVAFNSEELAITTESSILEKDVAPLIEEINTQVNAALSSANTDLIANVSRMISLSLANGSSSIVDIAAAMNLSQRTLQRKLGDKKTSYSALLDSVRFSMANQYLKSTYYRLTDIALLLGYSNLSSFSRAYFRYAGMYPMEVRKRISYTR